MQFIRVSESFELVGMDIVGPFPRTTSGNRFMLVITDHHTKWAMVIPLAKITSEKVASAFIRNVVLTHGAPKRIITDQGSNFNSALIRAIYKMLSIAKSRTSAYHPQCDGHTEKYNDTLCRMIAKLMTEYAKEWDELIPFAVFGYNISPQASTGFSPAYMLYGREPRLLIDHAFGHVDYPIPTKHTTYLKQLVDHLWETHQIAQRNMDKAQAQQRAQHDSKAVHSLNPFPPGSLVYVKDMTKAAVGTSGKFKRKYFGPCVVMDQTRPTNYLVKRDTFPEQVVHVWRLRPFIARRDFEEDAPVADAMDKPASTSDLLNKTEVKLVTTPIGEEEKDNRKPEINGPTPLALIPQTTIPHAIDRVSNQEEKEEGGTDLREDKIKEILLKDGKGNETKYMVVMTSGEQKWVYEEDMDCPKLLNAFLISKAKEEADYPHMLFKTLIESLASLLTIIERSPSMSPISIKRKLKEYVGTGNAFLKSRTAINKAERAISAASTRQELIELIRN